MKKSILIGLAFTLGMNSIAFAASSRVSNIQKLTAEERADLRAGLVSDLQTAKANLDSILAKLDDAILKRNVSVVSTALVDATGIMMFLFRHKVINALVAEANPKTKVVSLLATITTYYTLYTGIQMEKDVELNMQDVSELRELMKKTSDQIADLEKQLSAIDGN